MKKFAVYYERKTIEELIVKAKSEEAVIKKIKEVLGDIEIQDIWEVRDVPKRMLGGKK